MSSGRAGRRTPRGVFTPLAPRAVLRNPAGGFLGVAGRRGLGSNFDGGEVNDDVGAGALDISSLLRLSGSDDPERLKGYLRLLLIDALPSTVALPDGNVGYNIRRGDDCYQAAIATCLQAPYEEVPDSQIDERLASGYTVEQVNKSARERLRVWLAGRGLRQVAHDRLPVDLSRWIGIVHRPGSFQDHCFVMARDSILHDPAVILGVTCRYTAAQVETGVSFVRK